MSSGLEQTVVSSAGVPASAPRRRRVPTHFFVGTLLLYALVLGTFLLNASPAMRQWRPNWRTIVPVVAGVSFYVSANLFLLILGRGRVSRWTVLAGTLATLIVTAGLCLSLRAAMLHDRVEADLHLVRAFLATIAGAVSQLFDARGAPARAAVFAATIALEEAIKLAPVFVLIARRRISSAQGAMLCGALAGLTFGTVEAISYGYLSYPATREPITTYFTRFFIMSPLHGIWSALAGGLVFFLGGPARRGARRGPGPASYAAAFACAVVFHAIHNALQEMVGPAMQIATVFALLAPMYYMAKLARREAAEEGSPDRGQLVGDLHLLTVALGTLFVAAGVMFSWALGIY